ncbi:GH92 family glycosyl hydrolase [Kitasatospora terrestris]|uniref:GH92 family glycosyl hydrolase n=1 Tax=Kitasatospora terrestris TaxID=258051 RepID=A0ABP9ED81_9ACTN
MLRPSVPTRALAAAVAGLLLGAAAAPARAAVATRVGIEDPAQYVDPMIGTRADAPYYGNGGAAGDTFPGAAAPLGMVQWSPDTVMYQNGGGYNHDDNRITGFSLTHISGAGCLDYGTTPFMPALDDLPVDVATFDHAHESAGAGAYRVTLDNGVTTELTAGLRTGAARFGFPAGHTGALTIDAGRAFNSAEGSLTIGTDSVSGWTESGGFCGTGNRYRIHFHAVFDRPLRTAGILGPAGVGPGVLSATGGTTVAPRTPGHPVAGLPAPTAPRPAEGGDRAPASSGAKALIGFDLDASRTVTVRVGLSFVDAEGARANLAEQPAGTGFDRAADAARQAWNAWLGRIAVGGGTTAQRRVFYTALYHSLLHPSVLSDADGRYPGFDGLIRRTRPGHTQYATFSGWDVYRSQVQLVALLAPQEASDIGQSIVDQAASGGWFDRWTVANGPTGVMVGDPLPAMAATVAAFGATDFDRAGLLARAVAGRGDDRQRPGHGPYDAVGFVPVGTPGVGGPVSTALEYTTTDFALAQLAARLGDADAYDLLAHRATGWRNLFHGGSRYLQPRGADHGWPDFRPDQLDGFVESSAAQYTWMVPYNHRGLFDAMGGDGAVLARLDEFFRELNAGDRSVHAYLGNEPSFNTPWAYVYAGRPDRAQDVVRRAFTELFADTPGGEPGNDDLGALSSWAVWAGLGMYPQAPGRAELVLASPLFPAVTVRRGNGATIDITAPGASAATRYVRALSVDGKPSGRPWLSEEFVRGGGTLSYTLADTPDPGWGSAPEDRPPSFDVGPAQPRTGPVTGPGARCLDVDHSRTANGTPVQLWDCNGTAAQQWTLAPDGTLRALGKCLDVAASGTADATPVQLWDCNGTGAQQWWPRDGALRSTPSPHCLDSPRSATAAGTRLQIWTCNGTDAQRWTL